jgi:selenocysteine-specific elongation factor
VQRINITLGTAGHIDHGKTALVKNLTGCDTDRLKEEKERQMSIDLGYAPCRMGDTQVGLVDVPGHENFIKTMVAGAGGIDAVIFVVAADDGVMPQTREHLDILTLLGVRHGLVALTKIDRVDAGHLELARADLDDCTGGTFLEAAPVLPLSNTTGEGFDRFIEELWRMVASIPPRPLDGVFRLPLDRAFSAKGFGTVVAGIPRAGSVGLGDEIELLPHGDRGTVRQVEVYGQPAETAMAGECAALNVRGWDHHRIGRGDVVAAPGYFTPRQWFLGELRLLGREKLSLKNGAAVKFHTGTSEVQAAVYAMGEERLVAGGQYLVQLRAQSPVVAGPGDHFILRTFGPPRTVGGGVIVEALGQRLRHNRPGVLDDARRRAEAAADPRRFAEYCLHHAARIAAPAAEVARRAKLPAARAQEVLDELVAAGRAESLAPGVYAHRDALAAAAERLAALVADYHRAAPQSPGIEPIELRQAAGFERAVFDRLVERLRLAGRMVERGGRLALGEHRPDLSDEEARTIERIEALFRERPFAPPAVEELPDALGIDPAAAERLVKVLRERGRLVPVAPDLLFHAESIERARHALVEFLAREGRLESVKFKYLLDTTRKFAIPLLDYFDRVGVTRRVGNTRFPRARE